MSDRHVPSNLRNVIERILGNARACPHVANNVHVHRQLIGELRMALEVQDETSCVEQPDYLKTFWLGLLEAHERLGLPSNRGLEVDIGPAVLEAARRLYSPPKTNGDSHRQPIDKPPQ